ncbi:MAG: hypothetical protein QNJ57_05010 [Flavobacteriaceae bacterium]|nr:hypothetical protein [Flavobacteriaceae bacterium]
MSKGFFISCDEATTICTKNQYKEATFWEKLKLTVHLWTCKICGLYSKQNGKLTEVCDKHLHKVECDHALTDADKSGLKKKLAEANK